MVTEHIPTHKERAPDEVIDFQYNVTVFRGKLTSIVYIYIEYMKFVHSIDFGITQFLLRSAVAPRTG